jgi:putative NADH-flavin reductase
MAKVLVIGASRGVGLETVRAALRAGHSVRALARSVSSIRIHDTALDKVSGDALDRDTIRNALREVDAVIQTLGVHFSLRTILEGTTLFSGSTRVLVDAMKAAGVKRLIAMTGLGAGDSRGHGGLLYDAALFLLLKRVYDDKDVQEQIIKRSGLDWTIGRPGLLTDSPATGRYRVLTDSKDWRAGTISRADVADFLVRQIDDRAHAASHELSQSPAPPPFTCHTAGPCGGLHAAADAWLPTVGHPEHRAASCGSGKRHTLHESWRDHAGYRDVTARSRPPAPEWSLPCCIISVC